MAPHRNLPPALNHPEILEILSLLSIPPHDTRFVGGCVRDFLLGRPLKDIDLATTHVPKDVMTLLKKAGIKAVPTGIDHGTITAVTQQAGPVEITTLRRDIETDGRHAKVSFTHEWREDAARRDFTINALYMDKNAGIFDYFGGEEDLKQELVRFIGHAEDRIYEDALRILRFFRFSLYYGKLPLDQTGLKAAVKLREKLKKLSSERIWAELKKILSAPNPSALLNLMHETKILDEILSNVDSVDSIRQLHDLDPAIHDPLLRLFLITPEKSLKTLKKQLALSNQEEFALLNLHKTLATFDLDQAEFFLYQNRSKYGYEQSLRWLKSLYIRGNITLANYQDFRTRLEKLGPDPILCPLSGKDLLPYMEAGTEMGKVLDQVENWWISERFTPSKQDCLNYCLKHILKRKDEN